MEVSGSYEFNVPAAQVWDLLMDPEVLADCLPGVESLAAVSDDEYQASLTVGVGPIRGKYNAKIFLRDLNPPWSCRIVLEGTGPLGFANGDSQVTLTEQDGKTTLDIRGNAEIGGTVARVGQRMIGSVAQGMLDRFIKCIQESQR